MLLVDLSVGVLPEFDLLERAILPLIKCTLNLPAIEELAVRCLDFIMNSLWREAVLSQPAYEGRGRNIDHSGIHLHPCL